MNVCKKNFHFDLDKLNEFYNDKNTLSFVAKENNKIVGFVYGYDVIHPDGRHSYFIYSVGILSEYQDKGFGTKLLEFVKDYIKSHGFFEMFVMTDKGNHEDEICYVVNFEGNK